MLNRQQWARLALIGLALAGVLRAVWPAQAAPPRQSSTPTPPENRIEAFEGATVRNGPGTYYDRIGVLVAGETAQVLGRSPDNQWVQIVYASGEDNTGWVYVPNVRLVGDPLAIPSVEPPPTPTLPATPTSDLALPIVASLTPADNRLPTFTAPAPEIRPTLRPVPGVSSTVAFPPALLIIALFVLGTFAGLLSLMRNR
jgi:hypothetical protein